MLAVMYLFTPNGNNARRLRVWGATKEHINEGSAKRLGAKLCAIVASKICMLHSYRVLANIITSAGEVDALKGSRIGWRYYAAVGGDYHRFIFMGLCVLFEMHLDLECEAPVIWFSRL